MAENNLKNGLRTWLEIDKSLLKHNLRVFRSVIGKGTKLMAVVKSNAYGHGLIDFSKEISSHGADWLAVDSIVEGLALRREKIKKPVLVLGSTLSERIKEASKENISLTVSNFDALDSIRRLKLPKPVKVHIKFDTGMNRQGFFVRDIESVLDILKKNKSKIIVEGLYTHFAAAKNPSFPKQTLGQVELFKKCIDAFREAGFTPITHASATSGTLLFPQAHFDMVRVGIGLYGLWPSKEVEASRKRVANLKPILSWKTLIGEKKVLEKGSRLGYDLTEEMPRKTSVAICPVGYWHGYTRSLSGIGEVIVKGRKARVLGRVSMDMIAIDISKIPGVSVGDMVTLLGKEGRESVTADDIAYLSDTINYEVVTRINPLIKKFYI